MKPTFEQLKATLEELSIRPGMESIPLDEYETVIQGIKAAYGDEVGQFMMDCFMPEGDPIEPGFEDSLSHYLFQLESWEELRSEWFDS